MGPCLCTYPALTADKNGVLTCKFTTDWAINALRLRGQIEKEGLEAFPPIETYNRSCFLPLYYHEALGADSADMEFFYCY